MKKYCLDANIFITAWRIYPITLLGFHWVWNRLVILKNEGRIIIIDPIFHEIDPISSSVRKSMTDIKLKEEYPLRKWLEDNRFKGYEIDLTDQENALHLRELYEVSETTKGIDFNDTILVAYAHRREEHVVVTYEAKQKREVSQRNKKFHWCARRMELNVSILLQC